MKESKKKRNPSKMQALDFHFLVDFLKYQSKCECLFQIEYFEEAWTYNNQ